MTAQIVYQGGHHDIWCDGENHVATNGGWASRGKCRFRRIYKCDCDFWKTPREQRKSLFPEPSA